MNFSLILVFLQLIGGLKSNRPEVNIADQIAIRSLVLSKSLGKIYLHFCQIFFYTRYIIEGIFFLQVKLEDKSNNYTYLIIKN